MNKKLPFNIGGLGVYLFCLFITYLAGTYFSQIIYIIFIILLLYPIISMLILVLSYFNVKFHQDFSTEHPVKGEDLEYKLSLSNEHKIPFPNIKVSFRSVTPSEESSLPDLKLQINKGELIKKKYTISCPYRGTYTLGLKNLEISDLLHLVTLKSKVWHKTFYVYPRILQLTHFFRGIEHTEGGENSLHSGGEKDWAMFDSLKEYRPGEPIKHIYWKKLALTGTPMLKEFDSSPQSGIKIYFDLRKVTHEAIHPLEVEDTSVEILTALMSFFLRHEIKTEVQAPGRTVFEFTGHKATDFDSFYNSTSSLLFQDTISLVKLYENEERGRAENYNSIFFITHILDIDLFNLVEASLGSDLNLTIIFNEAGFTMEEKVRNGMFIAGLRNRGASIIPIRGPETIVEDLERDYR